MRWTKNPVPVAMSFEELEHTADVRLRVKAGSLESLFSEAARALMVVMYGSAEPGSMHRSIEVQAADTVSLMHAFLSEVLFISEVEEMVVSGADIRLSEGRLEGELTGEPFSMAKHRSGMEVKGISLSGLSVSRDNHTYILEVIFDV
jgi:SHS2 domain-containing protein